MENTMASNTIPEPTLQEMLHAATRKHHTTLNQHIISRFSLGFPPHASSPEAYQAGIILFGEIYRAFEETADALLASTSLPTQARQRLQILQIPRLRRSERLLKDRDVLRQRLNQSESPRAVKAQAAAMTASVRRNILDKPHTLLAFAWTMYLALFNGGRYMLKQLEKAGPEFWCEDGESADGRLQALSFWYFEGDARELHDEFKAKFDQAAEGLAAEERVDIVEQSKHAFDLCLDMVLWLDRYCADDAAAVAARESHL